MNIHVALYLASVLGAVSLLLIMPKQRLNLRLIGGLIGAATVGGVWLYLARLLPESLGGISRAAFAYYYVFSAIAIVGAVRVITHTRPVYSALWFIMVILSSAGLFLVLSAEFMAFAMVIIYGGAILVTYMFVIMLASQSTGDEPVETSPVYDRLAREPLSAVVAGFLLLAVLLSAAFEPMEPQLWRTQAATDQELATNVLSDRPARSIEGQIAELEAKKNGESFAPTALKAELEVANAERIGIDLFRSHPLGLELAGVILLVSLIGAVVIARTRVEGEGEIGTEPDMTGATVNPTYEPGPDESQSIGQSGGRVGM